MPGAMGAVLASWRDEAAEGSPPAIPFRPLAQAARSRIEGARNIPITSKGFVSTLRKKRGASVACSFTSRLFPRLLWRADSIPTSLIQDREGYLPEIPVAIRVAQIQGRNPIAS